MVISWAAFLPPLALARGHGRLTIHAPLSSLNLLASLRSLAYIRGEGRIAGGIVFYL